MYQKSSENFKPEHIHALLQREWNKRELSREATLLIYSDEWCEQRGFDAEVPVCSSLFRRDSSPICTSADLFFFLHKPNNLFLCKAVHPFEIFHSSQAPDVTLFYGAAATFDPAAILMNFCSCHQQLQKSTEGRHLFCIWRFCKLGITLHVRLPIQRVFFYHIWRNLAPYFTGY